MDPIVLGKQLHTIQASSKRVDTQTYPRSMKPRTYAILSTFYLKLVDTASTMDPIVLGNAAPYMYLPTYLCI